MQTKILEGKKLALVFILIMIAYMFSIGARMYWPLNFMDSPTMSHAGQLMINTNDGYYFASGAKDIIENKEAEDFRRASASDIRGRGLTIVTAFIQKISGISLETIILYLSAIISSLIVIPIILTGRLMGHIFIGFFAALLGSIAWSYYNRTMVGYYDSDMFAVFLQFSIFYSFMYIAYRKNIKGIIAAAVLIFMYPLFYPQGITLVYAMFILLVLYLVLEYKNIIKSEETYPFHEGTPSLYGSVILLSIPLMTMLPIEIRGVLFLVALTVLLKAKLEEKHWIYIALAFFVGFLYFGNVLNMIVFKVLSYLDRGVESEGLHFYHVIQTVREAGAIPFSTMANRISGSQLGLIISLIGYVVLVIRHKPFVIALPLIGVGILSLWAGLRFTVYAVPIAALSAVYLFYVLADILFKDKKIKYLFITLATAMMIYPNIKHIINYKVPTVLNQPEVNDLVKLKEISSSKDYTLAWWDYGYPIWFYSNTNTLIDGGKHTNDNFIISKIMQTTSPELAANLSRLAVETYVESDYKIVTDTLFKNKQEDQLDPNLLLSELENGVYPLPKSTRDLYLYLPYRMMNIFPTVTLFGNLDLTTGKKERQIAFYPTSIMKTNKEMIQLRNGIVVNTKKGEITLGQQNENIKYFISTLNKNNGDIKHQTQLYHVDGNYAVVYMKSYGRIVVMDMQTFNSLYVQMFILGKYDKDLFELVVSSPYTKIYKIKK